MHIKIYLQVITCQSAHENICSCRKTSEYVEFFAAVAELADAQDLESCPRGCRFNPCRRHQIITQAELNQACVILHKNKALNYFQPR